MWQEGRRRVCWGQSTRGKGEENGPSDVEGAEEIREILNVIFYLLRAGCASRMLPHGIPPWKTVYHCFRQWRRDGTWKEMYDTLRGQIPRQEGRNEEPSAAILDSQSVKTPEEG